VCKEYRFADQVKPLLAFKESRFDVHVEPL